MKKRSKKEEKQLQEEIKKYANEPRSIRKKRKRITMTILLQLNQAKNLRKVKIPLLENKEGFC